MLSYGALDDLTAQLAGLLREHGVEPGDRVGIMLPNVPQFAVAYYGVLRAGGIVVPMNVLLKRREVAFYLGDPDARVVLAWHEFADEAMAGAQEAGAECIIVRPGEFEQMLAGATPVRDVAAKAGRDTAVILADTLLRRLKRYGIDRRREGRHAALLTLAARLPAPILAERIGIHQSRAAAWVRMAGETYSDYVTIRSRDEHQVVTSDPSGASAKTPR